MDGNDRAPFLERVYQLLHSQVEWMRSLHSPKTMFCSCWRKICLLFFLFLFFFAWQLVYQKGIPQNIISDQGTLAQNKKWADKKMDPWTYHIVACCTHHQPWPNIGGIVVVAQSHTHLLQKPTSTIFMERATTASASLSSPQPPAASSFSASFPSFFFPPPVLLPQVGAYVVQVGLKFYNVTECGSFVNLTWSFFQHPCWVVHKYLLLTPPEVPIHSSSLWRQPHTYSIHTQT